MRLVQRFGGIYALMLLATRFPRQEMTTGSSKIPTVIWYDGDGRVQAVGAEAEEEGFQETAIENQWTKLEWYDPLHFGLPPSADLTQGSSCTSNPRTSLTRTRQGY